jgi:hypothetical protein
LYVLLISVRELATDSQLSGDLSIKGTFVEVPARSKSTLGVAFLALRGFPPFEVCKKGLVFAL